jgi:hypothetical protein
MVDNLAPSERGHLAELWYRVRHAPEAKAHVGVSVERSSGDNAGKLEGRVIDAVQGKTAIEVKDIKGKIDQEQFGAYLDMMRRPEDGGEAQIEKLKYVFTKPEGAIKSLELLAEAMERRDLQGRIIIEAFDRSGHQHTASTATEARTLLATLEEGT